MPQPDLRPHWSPSRPLVRSAYGHQATLRALARWEAWLYKYGCYGVCYRSRKAGGEFALFKSGSSAVCQDRAGTR